MAAKVGDKILTGKELMEWYQTECHGRPSELKEKLGLHNGERKAEFDFGERKVRQELIVPQLDVITHVKENMSSLEEDMACVSLVLEKRKLRNFIAEKWEEAAHDSLSEENRELLHQKEKELKRIEMAMQSFMTSERIAIEERRSNQELEEELMHLQEQESSLYAGSVSLLKECYHISEEQVDQAIEQKIRDAMGLKENAENQGQERKSNKRPKLTSAQKAAQSALMSEVKEKIQDKEILTHIISGATLSDEEKEKLSGIVPEEVVERYQEKMGVELSEEEEKARSEAKREERIRQQFLKVKNNPEQYEQAQREAVATIMFPDVSEEEVSRLLSEKHHLDVLNAERDKVDPPEAKKIEDLSSEERKRLEQEVRMNKLKEAQAVITTGIDAPTRINHIREMIAKAPQASISCSRFVYGNDWYICIDGQGRIMEEYMDESVPQDGLSRKTYEEEREKYKEKEEVISKEKVGEVTKGVSPEKKQGAIKQIVAEGKGRGTDHPVPNNQNNPNDEGGDR